MSMQQQLNQFGQIALKGSIAAIVNPNTISVVIDPASAYNTYANAIVAGDCVSLTNSTGNAILVDKANAVGNQMWVVLHNPKRDKFIGGDAAEVALHGSVVYMEATNAIGRGDKVEFVPSLSTVQKLSSTNTQVVSPVGTCLDKASANSTLVRILLSLS